MKTDKMTLFALFMTIFVDAAGMALVYPVLTPLFINNETLLFAVQTTEQVRNIFYGFMLAIYPIMMFIGSPFLGTLSDKYGRKKILIICMAGNLIGLIIMGLGVSINSLFSIIFARIISGITAASLPVAQAAMIDISSDEEIPRNLSLITAANSIGFIVGPMITGILSKPILGFTPSLASPFYMASLLPLFTLILLIFYSKETYNGNKKLKLNFMTAFSNIYYRFRDKSTELPLYILTSFLVGYYMFFNYLSMFSLLKFGYDQLAESMLLGYFSFIFGMSFLLIIPYLLKRFSLNVCLLISIIPQFFAVLLLVLLTYPGTLWTVAAIMAIFVPCSYVVLLSILSNKTEKACQGSIMGVCSSVNSFAWGMAPLLTAFIQNQSLLLPFIISTVILLIALMLSVAYIRNCKADLELADVS